MNKFFLSGDDWLIKEFYGEDWIWRNSEKENTSDYRFWKKATVPGTIQNDLLKLNEIENPYFGLNSLKSEWVTQRTWIYKKKFFANPKFENKNCFICFLGIDFRGKIFLNDEEIATNESMFVPLKIDISEKIKWGKENFISVVLEKAPDGEPQVSKTRYVNIHKSRMSYWWDFCPRIIHMGIWQDVYIESYNTAQVENIFVKTKLLDNFKNAEITVECEIISHENTYADINLEIDDNDGKQNINLEKPKMKLEKGLNKITLSTSIKNPKLWNLNNMGEQNLYKCKVTISNNNNVLHSKCETFGIKEIIFVNNETDDKSAAPYTLKFNGKIVFMNGWNWVPVDVMSGAASDEKYIKLIKMAKIANVNILRVWGGGLIEKEIFYKLCDENGILIWQEFIQSSSGIENKPSTSKEFIEHMEKEAEGIIPIRRNHPSLAIWGGGNELAFNDIPLTDEEPVLKALKKKVNSLDPERHWLATSPTGKLFLNSLENIKNDPNSLHDVHGPWEFQGLKEHYQLYNSGTSLLSSEFGVEGMANLNTLKTNMPKDKILPTTKDNPFYFHRGSWWNNTELVYKIFDGDNNFDSIEKIQKASQFLQAEGLKYSVESNRRRQYKSSGTFPWQFNEPFPNNFCTSAIDYYCQPKPAYYTVGRAYSKILYSAKFETQSLVNNDFFEFEVYGSNSLYSDIKTDLKISVIGSDGEVYYSNKILTEVCANSTNKVFSLKLDLKKIKTNIFLLSLDSDVSNRYVFTKTENLSELFQLKQGEIEIVSFENNNLILKNKSEIVLFGIWIEDDMFPCSQSSMITDINGNYIHLLPDESISVNIGWLDSKENSIQISGINLKANLKK